MKFLLLYRRTWRDSNFNYRFDANVYAVFTSLDFAAFENRKCVMGDGLTVAVPRALLAIPGHMSLPGLERNGPRQGGYALRHGSAECV